MKNKKHDEITQEFEKAKRKHLENLGTRLLKQKEKEDKLKTKKIKTDFLKLF